MSDTKKCKYCKTEIPKDAKICPNCKKKQKGKTGLIIAIVLIVLIGVAAGSKKDKKQDIDNSNAKNTTNVAANEETKSSDKKSASTPSETKEEKEDEAVLVGGSYEGNGIKFTVNDAIIDYQFEDKYGLHKLDEGYVYLLVDFTFENIGNDDKYVSIYDFDCYADNASCEQQYVTEETGDFINTNLSSGRTVSFKTLYAIPAEAASIELEYEPDVWSDEKVLVKIK